MTTNHVPEWVYRADMPPEVDEEPWRGDTVREEPVPPMDRRRSGLIAAAALLVVFALVAITWWTR